MRAKLCILGMILFALAPRCGAQMREDLRTTGVSSTQSAPPGEVSEPRDSLSTTLTGAPALIGPGDQIEIGVFDTPELTQRVRVSSEGKITLSLIGDLQVSNITPEELRGRIAEELVKGRFVRNPQVSVFVSGYAGQISYVDGEVLRPGAYPLLRSHRLLDLIAVAGGPTAWAGNSVTVTKASAPALLLRLELSGGTSAENNPEIFPGDRITISRSGIVYVLGEVTRPGGFVIGRQDSISVLQALSLAEGLQSSASITKATLIRKDGSSTQQIPVNVKKILKAEVPDVAVQAGDILYIQGSLTRGLGRSALITAIGTASAAAIYFAAVH